MKTTLVLLACACMCACMRAGPTTSPAAVDVQSVDAAPLVVATADAAPAPAAPPPPDSPYPPTGTYRVTSKVVSDDCSPRYQGPSDPWPALVHARAEGDVAKVNVPLVALPPYNALSPIARVDLPVKPAKVIERKWVPMPACFSYELSATLEVTKATSRSFELVVTVDHGDAMKCSSTPPSHCKTSVVQTFELETELCRAECTRGLAFGGDAGPKADCRCP